jgi:hypothetical protein
LPRRYVNWIKSGDQSGHCGTSFNPNYFVDTNKRTGNTRQTLLKLDRLYLKKKLRTEVLVA